MERASLTSEGTKIYDRIRGVAKSKKQNVDFAFRKFAMERLIVRLEESEWCGLFALKGGMLMLCLPGGMNRPTDDLDLSSPPGTDAAALLETLAVVCAATPSKEDGLKYQVDVDACHVMRVDSVNPTMRAMIDAVLHHAYGRTEMRLKLDVSEGDEVFPEMKRLRMPESCKGFEPPELRCYPWETVVAEKLHAVAQHGAANTRMRDYFDLVAIHRNAEFDPETLAQAVISVFGIRNREIDPEPFGLSDEFAASKENEWKRLLARKSLSGAPATMSEAVRLARAFAGPILARAAELAGKNVPRP